MALHSFILFVLFQTIFASPILEPIVPSARSDPRDVTPRAAYAQPAAIQDYPYYVYLEVYTSKDRLICGATIISQLWLVTAAHCTENNDNIFAIFGDDDKTKVIVDKVVIHPEYNAQMLTNDIALLRLSKPLTFGDTIQPVKLPDTNPNIYGILHNKQYSDEHFRYYNNKVVRSDYSDYEHSVDYDDQSSEESHDNDSDESHDNASDESHDNACDESDDNSSDESHDNDSDESHDHSFVESDDLKQRHNFKDDMYTLVSRGVDAYATPIRSVHKINIFVVKASTCYLHMRYPFNPRLDEMVLCGVRAEHLPGAGRGDSGSPLVKKDTLYGITSYMLLSSNGLPIPAPRTMCHSQVGFYVNVASYVSWIKSEASL